MYFLCRNCVIVNCSVDDLISELPKGFMKDSEKNK